MPFKIILTGVTGRIGSEVLQQCLAHTSVTSVVALARRTLPHLTHPKLEIIVMQDFGRYSDEVLVKLAGADGCIWCMTTTKVEPALELEYPLAFAKAFSSTLAQHKKKFRYLHLSGGLVERDQNKSLWLKADLRKLKGRGEMQMVDFARDPATESYWETIVARPGYVVNRKTMFGSTVGTLLGANSIPSDGLALALIDAVVDGSEEQLLLPASLLESSQKLLSRQEAVMTEQ